MESDTYCVIPFIHMEARADGFVSPCCLSQEFYRKNDGSLYNLSRDTLTDVWNSDAINSLRTSLKAGEKPSACKVCWEEESCGKQSKRQRENFRWNYQDEPHFRFLDLKLGNTCNLKCRTCTISSSSNWTKETIETGEGQLLQNYANLDPTGNYRKILQWPLYNNEFWKDFENFLTDIELFEIYGGEPFLSSQHFNVLEKSIALGYSKNQSIHYNTNGTIFPDHAVKNIWPNFKRVDVMLSIDGVGKQFEYLRHPAEWNAVLDNLNKFRSVFSKQDLQVCLTISALNIFYVPEYLDFFSGLDIDVYLNIVHVPVAFSAKYLPDDIKEKIINKLEQYLHLHPQLFSLIGFLQSPQDDYYLELMRKIQLHDIYRNENYFETFPEFGEVLMTHRKANQIYEV